MQNWKTGIGGAIIAIASFVHGLPGFFDDSKSWVAWVNVMELTSHLWLIGVFGGVLIATWGWWRKYLLRVRGKVVPNRKMKEKVEQLEYETALNSAKSLLLKLDVEEHVDKSKDK